MYNLIGQQKQVATCPAHGGGEEVLVSWSKGRRCNSKISLGWGSSKSIDLLNYNSWQHQQSFSADFSRKTYFGLPS